MARTAKSFRETKATSYSLKRIQKHFDQRKKAAHVTQSTTHYRQLIDNGTAPWSHEQDEQAIQTSIAKTLSINGKSRATGLRPPKRTVDTITADAQVTSADAPLLTVDATRGKRPRGLRKYEVDTGMISSPTSVLSSANDTFSELEDGVLRKVDGASLSIYGAGDSPVDTDSAITPSAFGRSSVTPSTYQTPATISTTGVSTPESTDKGASTSPSGVSAWEVNQSGGLYDVVTEIYYERLS